MTLNNVRRLICLKEPPTNLKILLLLTINCVVYVDFYSLKKISTKLRVNLNSRVT